MTDAPAATAPTPAPASPSAKPKRERKKVEVFQVVDDAPKKSLDIKAGRGTKLCEIPNVAFKLSKIPRKEELLKFVYRILYKGVGKQQTIKRDIGEFSGWTFENDGERAAKEDLLSRAFKDTLHDILDLFELPRGSGADGKKEAQVARLMTWLDAPKASGKKSLEEAEAKKRAAKEKKRERTAKKTAAKAKKTAAAKSSAGGSAKQAALIKKLKAENAALRAKIAKLTGKEEEPAEEDEEEEEEEEEEDEEDEEERRRRRGRRRREEEEERKIRTKSSQKSRRRKSRSRHPSRRNNHLRRRTVAGTVAGTVSSESTVTREGAYARARAAGTQAGTAETGRTDPAPRLRRNRPSRHRRRPSSVALFEGY